MRRGKKRKDRGRKWGELLVQITESRENVIFLTSGWNFRHHIVHLSLKLIPPLITIINGVQLLISDKKSNYQRTYNSIRRKKNNEIINLITDDKLEEFQPVSNYYK